MTNINLKGDNEIKNILKNIEQTKEVLENLTTPIKKIIHPEINKKQELTKRLRELRIRTEKLIKEVNIAKKYENVNKLKDIIQQVKKIIKEKEEISKELKEINK